MISEDAALFRQFVRAVFQTQNALVKHGDEMNAPYGQTSATWRVLLHISKGYTTVAGIARSIGTSRQAVQRLADGLVASGLACYAKHPTDDRTQQIAMTPTGEATFQSLEGHFNRWGERLLGTLSARDLADVTARLHQVKDAVEEDARRFSQKPTKTHTRKDTMPQQTDLGGTFTLPGTSLTVHRLGYGAMQLAGPGVWGPPRDPDAAVAVLRDAVALGVDHIDTSDFYGPHITNRIIRQALYPYPDNLILVTKIGARRGDDRSWNPAFSPEDLTAAVHDNLQNLGLDVLDIVNLRFMFDVHGPAEGPIEEPLTALAELQQQGLVRHIGVSNVTPEQVAQAQAITPIVCVQNQYNLAHREDDALIDTLAAQGIAYVPFFPLGGFTPLQSSVLDDAAKSLDATPMQVALAWLLQRSPNILLIPGTSSVAHLRENLQVAALSLPPETLAALDAIA